MRAMHNPEQQERRLSAAAIIASAVFWCGFLALWFMATGRYFPDYPFEFQLGPLLAAIILAYTVDFLGRARWMAILRGHAVAIGPQQFRDLYERLGAVCKRLGAATVPRLWLLTDRLRGRPSLSFVFGDEQHVVLNAELVGAFTDHQGALDYFLGAELARLRLRGGARRALLAPAMVVPLLGPAYARALVYATDRAGLTGCRAKADAALALGYSAAGSRRWKSLNLLEFAAQPGQRDDFLPLIMEVASGTPWLSRRIARLHAAATGSEQMLRARRPLAYVVAAVIPRLGLFESGAWWRAGILTVWIGLAGLLFYVGNQWAGDQTAMPGDAGVTHGAAAVASNAASHATSAQPADVVGDSALVRLDYDLKRLGALAAARHQKLGGNTCEIGNIARLDLNYPASRYAFSCDEPVVYTAVEPGEFEPGKPSYLRMYNWLDNRFVSPESATPAKPQGEKPSTTVGR
jgi:hypothetical protein